MECIFTDFSKADDSVWHDGLMYKLYFKHNIKGQFLKCINSFSRNRYTRVLLRKGQSVWKLQKLGLPQGSSLSPILYILFTLDFNITNSAFIKMGCFADDTAFWTVPSSLTTTKYKLLQQELNEFSNWTKFWKMSLNPGKCTTLKIHRKHRKCPNFQHEIDSFAIKKESGLMDFELHILYSTKITIPKL